MKKCNDCKLYFLEKDLEDGSCLGCRFPWNSEEDLPRGFNFPDGPPSHLDLLTKAKVNVKRLEVTLPYAHDPKNYYVEAEIYEGPGRYWHIEGRSCKFKDQIDALIEVVKTADMRRLQLLNKEFEELFGD